MSDQPTPLYQIYYADENEYPRGKEGWIFAGTDDEFGILDRWMVPVEPSILDQYMTRLKEKKSWKL